MPVSDTTPSGPVTVYLSSAAGSISFVCSEPTSTLLAALNTAQAKAGDAYDGVVYINDVAPGQIGAPEAEDHRGEIDAAAALDLIRLWVA